MIVGILGLGLIGGSMARAFAKAGHTVLACETNQTVLSFSRLAGVVTEPLTGDNLPDCRLILLAVTPESSIAWLQDHAPQISKEALVLDCCGVKREICKACFPLADHYGFTFAGCHPMAGSHFSGFKYSRANLFQGAPMVMVPPRFDDPQLLGRVQKALEPCHFGSFSVTTADEHDRMIAFTSQIPHIISNAYIKSPTAAGHHGFSAGSYKDLTRVAWLNPTMWAELCLENRDFALDELNTCILNLSAYRDALENRDFEALETLLDQGRKCKEALDGPKK